MRIRTRLLLLVLAVLIPAFLAAALGIGYVYGEAQKSHRKSLREATRALALLVDNDIEARAGILQSLADSPALDRGDLATFYEHALKTGTARDAGIVLADPEGRVLLNTAVPFGTRNIRNSGTLLELRKRHGPDGTVVSNLYISPHRGTRSFAIQVPVRRGGQILYYLSMGADARQFQAMMARQSLPQSWIGAILDRNGLIVARSHEPETYAGRSAREGLIALMKVQPEGFYDGTTLSGESTLASFSHAPQSEWTFVVNVPQEELQRTALRATVFMGSVSLILLGFALLGAFAVARKTVGPIEALRLSAERLGSGDTVLPVASGIREMDEVAAAMARASADIHNGKAELERRVEEAVATTERSQRALLQAQKLEALGRLTGGIAHDFNNVLQTITSGLQLAHMSSGDGRVKSLIETCERAVERAVELTRKLMAFGRVQDARLETLDMNQLLGETLPLLKGGLASHIDFRLAIADGLWPVTLDKLQFELALLNLTINARHAMPRGGSLQLEACNETIAETGDEPAAGDYVRITVADSGEGMSNEVLARALDPFFTTKGVGQGSGMGLPQAYGFARQTGGILMLRSQPGQGTQAVLYLPKAEAAATPRLSAAPKLALHPTLAGGVVLFVEDDELVADVIRPALEAAGFEVKVVKDGEEALQTLDMGMKIDYVFSDIVMPGTISGIDLAELVRQRHPHIPVVLATGYSDRRVSLPGVRILAKPYDVAEVVAALTAE
jgi:signal transduction histidine kinase/CheY-like chemotaxis protein